MQGEPSQLRAAVQALVGWSDGPGVTHSISRTVEDEGAFRSETLWLEGNPPFPATLLLPEGAGPHPAVLYCHAHGGDYALGRRELTEGARWLDRALGAELVKAGFAVLAIDAIGFGDRQDEWSESAAAKSLFWRGESLFGAMLDELRDALGYLLARPEVDAARVFTFGVSMGAAHAWWLAALDDRVAGTAHACMLADIAGLLHGAVHDRHGLYFVVPGLLRVCEQGDVAGLVAPRPQFVAHGGADHLTPEGARKAALGRLSKAYAEVPEQLEAMFVPEAGHELTEEMRKAAVGFLTRHAGIKERMTT
jgi:dienelactone hydrolase